MGVRQSPIADSPSDFFNLLIHTTLDALDQSRTMFCIIDQNEHGMLRPLTCSNLSTC